jgi:hypothetical protein
VRLLQRVPTRLRLTLAFAAGMTVVLLAMGLFLYLRLGAALEQTIDQSLWGRADDVAALVRASGPGLREAEGNRLVEQEETSPRCSTRTASSWTARPGSVAIGCSPTPSSPAPPKQRSWSTGRRSRGPTNP